MRHGSSFFFTNKGLLVSSSTAASCSFFFVVSSLPKVSICRVWCMICFGRTTFSRRRALCNCLIWLDGESKEEAKAIRSERDPVAMGQDDTRPRKKHRAEEEPAPEEHECFKANLPDMIASFCAGSAALFNTHGSGRHALVNLEWLNRLVKTIEAHPLPELGSSLVLLIKTILALKTLVEGISALQSLTA